MEFLQSAKTMPVGPEYAQEYNAVHVALKRLILFCTEGTDTNPFTRDGPPIVTHQQLLLDQAVHTLLFRMLAAPFSESRPWGARWDLEELPDNEGQVRAPVCPLALRPKCGPRLAELLRIGI